MLKYSAIGPSAKAGKKQSATTIMIVANTIIPNVPVSVFNVPALSGIYFFFARMPAIATGPIIGMNLANSITIPHVMFQNGTPSPRPSNPEPLFADDDEYS